MRWLLVTVAGTGLALVAGCGGGGGDEGGGSVVFDTTPVVYAGSTSAAVITATNAGTLVANLFGGGSSTPSFSVARKAHSPDTGQVEAGRIARRGMRTSVSTALKKKDRLSLSISVDESIACAAGSGRISGTLSDIGTGTLTVTYNNCLIDEHSFTGLATAQVNAFDPGLGIITDATLSFPRLSVRGSGVNVEISGTIGTVVFLPNNSEKSTQSVVTLDNPTGRMTKSENLVVEDRYDNFLSPSSYLQVITGRIYDAAHGFVDVDTLVMPSFGTTTQDFPDSGLVRLIGAARARIHATALSSGIMTISLDLNADATFETTATLAWVELGGPAGADLADSDGDGMHNGWEDAKGLDRSSAADAALDPDGDGAGNRSEYLAGSDPRSGASTPPTVGLSLSVTDGPDPVALGSGGVDYVLTVTNASSSPAINVVLSNTLQPGVNLSRTISTQGSCTGTQVIVCTLGTVSGFATVSVTVEVNPSLAGIVTNSATVTSNSFDPNTSDNTASNTTTVGFRVQGLQNMINAAPDGGTVNVPPALYIGALDFNGKNVVLQSTAGPAQTILHGNNGLALRMGPGGTLRGFTVTGSPGLAVEVIGNGSVIAGNVFTGNARVIEGNNVSPVIEGNIFRSNGCNNASNVGLIQPFNNSSPVIRNNVFENNSCFAVYLVLPSGNVPQVINNTFVGNFGAIKVDRRVPQTTQIYRNNLIVENGTGLHVDVAQGTTDADNPVWQNNLVFGTGANYQGTADQTGTNGNISVEPLLVNQSGGDYHLQPASPAIDAGSPTGAPATDFDGNPRGTPDIGAFEAVP